MISNKVKTTMQLTPSTSAGQQSFNDVKQISELTPQKTRQTNWPICVEVVKKCPKEVSVNGTPFFKVQLRDKSGYIEALAYYQNVDRYYNQLDEKQNYYFENATLQPVDHNFQNVGHEFKIILQDSATIRACDKTIETAPTPHLTSFEEAQELEPSTADNPINLLGLLLKTGPLETKVIPKSGKQVYMRDITLMDKTKATLKVTLWRNEAKTFKRPPNSDHPVVLVKGVRVKNKFMGVPVLSTVNTSVFMFNPNIPEMKKLEPLVRKFGKNNEEEGIQYNKDTKMNKHARKGTKRCIESDDDDDDDEAFSDVETIFIDCPETFLSETTHEVWDLNDFDDVQSPRKKIKYSRIPPVLKDFLKLNRSLLRMVLNIQLSTKSRAGKPPAWLDSVVNTEECMHTLTDVEAVKFPETLGFGWELLGVWLGIDDTNIQRIKMDYPNETKVQINQLLLEWRRMNNEKATLNALLVALKKCSESVNISWKLIKKNIIDAL